MEEIEARLKALDAKLGVKPGPENSVWDRAPEWARFWARDPDGAAWFYELKPEWDETYQEWGVAGGMAGHDRSLEHSLASLSERPAGVEPEPVPEIDWSRAPDWARYVAMDEDGEWYWYGLRPRTCEDADCWFGGGQLDYYKETGCWVGWRSSLVERPGTNPGPWSEDPDYPVSDWQFEVRNNDTRLGYREWVEHRKEED
jgi:hypothetical protein